MSVVRGRARRAFSMCSKDEQGQAESELGGAEGAEREEGKIKADGTPWVRSGGQALVCTLFGTALPLGWHGAAGWRKPSIRRVFDGTLAANRRFWPGCRR